MGAGIAENAVELMWARGPRPRKTSPSRSPAQDSDVSRVIGVWSAVPSGAVTRECTATSEAPRPALDWSAVAAVAAVARAHADEVDADSRFPLEAINALKANGLLSCSVAETAGGLGISLSELSRIARKLGSCCSSTGAIFAMHHGQLMSIDRRGTSERLRSLVDECVAHQLLLASSTSEVGLGGDPLASTCAVHRDGDHFTLTKNAPVISYAQYADAILVTARRDEDAAQHDQVLVVCRKNALELEQTSEWDVLGLRGTCSPGFMLNARGPVEDILDDYGILSSTTTLPVTHILFASVWLGIADGAIAKAALAVRRAARKSPSQTPPSALRLAELLAQHQQFVSLVAHCASEYERCADDHEHLTSTSFVLMMNNLKVSAATLVTDLLIKSLNICGIAGYRNNDELSLGRMVRDALSASIMVNNDRLLGNNAQMVRAFRG